MSDSLKYCFIIPCYQHSKFLDLVLNSLEPFNYPVILVNDGSDEANSLEIKTISSKYKNIKLLVHSKNQGKGAAVKTAFKEAYSDGYTHAIQVDSDGQHELQKVSDMVAISKQYPRAVISGKPVYDESVPAGRLYGRKFTQMWVYFETFSTKLEDTMCGFRIYPLAQTVKLINEAYIGQKMDFDIEILVKLFWRGVTTKYVPVKVVYPDDGVSHFRMLKDNWLIIKMHTRLMFGMIPRIPKLLFKKNNDEHWAKQEERGSESGMKILLFIYNLLGYRFMCFLLYFVSFYYYLFPGKVGEASKKYISIYKSYCEKNNIEEKPISVFKHIHAFSRMALDKVAVWQEDISYDDIGASDVEALHSLYEEGKGALFISSHYGNIEISRAMGRKFPEFKINALMYTENSKKFRGLIKAINIEAEVNVISVDNFGIDAAIILQDKVDKGEWVFILADRLSVSESKQTYTVNVLGQPAKLPKGPFLLANLLGVPAYYFHCYRDKNKFRFKLKELIYKDKSRSSREKEIARSAEEFGKELDHLITSDPKQWFNFFKFWNI